MKIDFCILKMNYLFILNTILLLQDLILSNALRTQKNIEDEGCTMVLNNLRSEVIELRNEGHEKDKILISLVNKIKEDEANSKVQAEAQKNGIEDLRRQLAEAKVKCVVAEADRDASEYWKIILKRQLQSFNFVRGDPEGVIEWISSEVEAFEEILNDRGDVCAFSGVRGVAAAWRRRVANMLKPWPRPKLPFLLTTRRTLRPKQVYWAANFSLIFGTMAAEEWLMK
jgi:hypothetical protein